MALICLSETGQFLDPTTPQQADPTLPPSGEAMLAWMARAELQLDHTLAEFDQLLVQGTEPTRAAHLCIQQFMGWTRRSVSLLIEGMSLPEGAASLRGQERAFWEWMADEAAREAHSDPAHVDRFLSVWLATVQVAVVHGHGAMFAVPGDW